MSLSKEQVFLKGFILVIPRACQPEHKEKQLIQYLNKQ